MSPDDVDLRDYFEQRIMAERERTDAKHAELITMVSALKYAREQLTEAHAVAHAREHEATDLALTKAHDVTREAIKLGRDSAAELASVHAAAHEREHVAHQHEHVLTEDALKKAATHIDQRLAAMNEFREQLRDQAATFVRRELMDAEFKALAARLETAITGVEQLVSQRAQSNADRITVLEQNQAQAAGRDKGIGTSWAVVLAVVGLVGGLIGIVVFVLSLRGG